MIELNASSENAFKLYNFLNKGERKHIKVNGINPKAVPFRSEATKIGMK